MLAYENNRVRLLWLLLKTLHLLCYRDMDVDFAKTKGFWLLYEKILHTIHLEYGCNHYLGGWVGAALLIIMLASNDRLF